MINRLKKIAGKYRSIKNIWSEFNLNDNHMLKFYLIFYGLFDFTKLQITIFRRLKKDRDVILTTIDRNSFATIQKKYSEKSYREFFSKYLDIDRYLPRNLFRAYRLGIHNSKSLNILDIGAGAGYFCLICNYFGHNAKAMDLDRTAIFNDTIHFFAIDRKVGKVEAFVKLPQFDEKFDLITAFYSGFNKAANPSDVWRVDKWKFFLRDLANNLLKKNGRLIFYLHPETDGKHYSKNLLQFFLNNNAIVLGQTVYFKDIRKLRLLS